MKMIHMLLLFGALVLLAACAPQGKITSFEQCVQAGYPVMESSPRQCSDGNQTFTENLSVVGGDVDAHGCKASAGYAYDQDIGACVRSWELNATDDRRAATVAVQSLPTTGWTVVEVVRAQCDGCFAVKLNKGDQGRVVLLKDWQVVPDSASADDTVCSAEYAPVCGELQVQCIRAPCPPINTTFSNRCEAQKRGATDIRDGPCQDTSSPEGACLSFDGRWIAGANECEGMSQEQCLSLGGSFDACASACRNDPEAQVCTMQCVMVCSFD